MQLHYKSVGQGQPLILLHGLFGASDNWGTIAKHFSQHYQVISVDLRNHGQSPHDNSQTYANMAEDIKALCEQLALDPIHLIGHSLGGKVAMQFATLHPKRVQKLVIVDMAMRAYQDEHTHLIDAMLALDLKAINTRSAADKALSQHIKNTMIRQFLLMNLVKSDEGLTWRINLPALKANFPELLQAVCESAQYDKPCLFIHGEKSDYVQESDITHISMHFAQATFASLPTDHWVHAEQPTAFINLVESFLIA